MPIETVHDLVQCLTRYPFLGPAQRDELDGLLKARFTDPRTLAKELVLREWLTPYQVNQLLQGRAADLMLGSYVLQERLTEGALGQLFKARHLHMKRTVALQVVRPDLLKDPRAVERFYAEIQAVSQLSHQHLVAAYDAGPSGDSHFFAMEYVEGIDLERHIQQEGPLTVARACACIRQTARGLQHAFERGLLHHDLRPANILLTRNGERRTQNVDDSSGAGGSGAALVKVRNLGLTLIRQHTKHTRLLVGAGPDAPPPDYLAPERPLGSPPADVRAELYSLGGTFYFLLTGQVPFPDGSAEEKIHRHQTEQPAPVEALRPEVPPEVAALVARLLAKAPEYRFANPREVADILDPPAPVETIAAPPAKKDLVPLVKRALPPKAERRRGGRFLALGGTGLAAALVWLGWLLARPGGTTVSPTTGPEETLHPGILATVEANRPWQDTGVEVRAGEPITLFASGWWRGGPRKSGCSPDGDKKQPVDRNLIVGANPMALVGWVAGEDGPFVIGVHKVHVSKVNGRLFVQANDLDCKDNSGQVKLQVAGGERNVGLAVLWEAGYGEWDVPTKRVKNYQPMTYRPDGPSWAGPLMDEKNGAIWVSGFDGHPGPFPKLCVVRRWRIGQDAVVALTGTLTHPRGEGDGVRARLVCSSRKGLLAGSWQVHNNKAETNVPRLNVRRGDILEAVVDCRGNYGSDQFSWPLNVRVLEGPPENKK